MDEIKHGKGITIPHKYSNTPKPSLVPLYLHLFGNFWCIDDTFWVLRYSFGSKCNYRQTDYVSRWDLASSPRIETVVYNNTTKIPLGSCKSKDKAYKAKGDYIIWKRNKGKNHDNTNQPDALKLIHPSEIWITIEDDWKSN